MADFPLKLLLFDFIYPHLHYALFSVISQDEMETKMSDLLLFVAFGSAEVITPFAPAVVTQAVQT